MQQTVEEFKQQHAKECGFDNWKELIESLDNDFDLIDFYYNGINIAYSEQEVKKYLEIASEEVTAYVDFDCAVIDRTSITNIKIELT